MQISPSPVTSSRLAEKFVLRLPNGMRERLADVARSSRRSMNSEMISRLEQSLVPAAEPLAEELVESGMLTEYEARLIHRFRKLGSRQQTALIELIAADAPEPRQVPAVPVARTG